MNANRRYWEADRNEDDLWVVGMRENGGFSGSREPDITFEPMGGDEVGRNLLNLRHYSAKGNDYTVRI